VGDAHLNEASPEAAGVFQAFLQAALRPGDHLLITGDLFDVWFEYRRVIPAFAFGTLAALAALRGRGVRLTVVGGNHDRWGGSFWEREAGAAFHRHAAELELNGFRAYAAHGDGVGGAPLSRFLRLVAHAPLSTALVRLAHPDLALPVLSRFARRLAGSTRHQAALERASQVQASWARAWLRARPEVRLLILGHTHRPALEAVAEGRWYLNPGAWLDGGRYAAVTAEGPALRRFG
jgi:UDP-2,3-diacylglucosamine hydrolase